MGSEVWAVGDAYEAYIGRWSRRVAEVLLPWLALPGDRRWLDVGCGTGALTAAALASAQPAEIIGIDPSEGFLATAGAQIVDPRVTFRVGDAQSIPFADNRFDVVVSGLALNFVPDPHRAVAEFARVARHGGVVAAYVWDYADGMAMLRFFWDSAASLDPAAAEEDEARRFPICQPDALREVWTGAGLDDVAVQGIEIPTVFVTFEDYWRPFLGSQGPAPGYVTSLPDQRRDALRDRLRDRLPVAADGSISLTARAWAVRGTARH
jgi:SAM-dependent methyltransferase